jgi:hypothetical protein
MRFELVARGHQPGQIAGACINVGDLLTSVAMKVMMVVFVDLIAIRLAWQRDHIHDSVSDQALAVAIDRGQAEVGDCLLSLGQ